ncbi:glycerol-3-phosphate 1-O-acyltransferase PlsY [Limnochorda pilosa]|uniref:Glycerol-3-phosphate acyltransferase n=1 Tax=Limnochorda pilosa TaxID=1555112 RepID=A0A0K2SJ63_LIMPI|nr:glycerol-3-phosphate 1-O-acyltransferase PlsY [Limnochorda pilosa]BAS27072.1 membrane protein [Limnochorda pilosa]
MAWTTGLLWAGLLVGSYLVGSIPFALIMGKVLRGVDVRHGGSGNVGSTNLLRLAGWLPAALAFSLDLLKGTLPALAGAWLAGPVGGLMAGLAAVAGHNWSVYLRGRGGKGVATSLGVLLAVAPVAALVAVALFLLVVVLTRYVSLGSITASLSVPVALWLLGAGWYEVGLGGLLTALLVLRHRPNIARLLAGTENRFRSPRPS